MKIKTFECPKSISNYEKKIMLGASDDWSMSRSFHQASEPSVLYWRLSDLWGEKNKGHLSSFHYWIFSQFQLMMDKHKIIALKVGLFNHHLNSFLHIFFSFFLTKNILNLWLSCIWNSGRGWSVSSENWQRVNGTQ